MKDNTFKGLSYLIAGLMTEGKRGIANNVFNAVRHTLTTEQRKEAGGIIKPRKESDTNSASRVIDEKELFLKYGDADQKKRIVAERETSSNDAGSEVPDSVTDYTSKETEIKINPNEDWKLSSEPFDNYQTGDLIKTVSPAWENATQGAKDLANEYPGADWSVFVGVDRITKNDVKSELQKQGYDV